MSFSSTSRDSTGTTRKTASENYCKTLSAIQRSDQNLWPFSAVILIWCDRTSSSTSRDSIGKTRKTAFGNYCETLSAIQRSDQKLWPFSPVIPVWLHKASFSTSRDSIGNTRKTASGNYCKTLTGSNGRIKSYGTFQLLFWSGATWHPLQGVGIP
jgi:hypothetical protein